MGRAPSGAPAGVPLDLSAAGAGAPGGGGGLGMLANALGGLGQGFTQQAPPVKPLEPLEPLQMPVPIAMRGSLVASILARGGRV